MENETFVMDEKCEEEINSVVFKLLVNHRISNVMDNILKTNFDHKLRGVLEKNGMIEKEKITEEQSNSTQTNIKYAT